MPHLGVHVLESDLAGRETVLIEKLTDAIVDVFGERVRGGVTVELIGAVAGRTGVGGVVTS